MEGDASGHHHILVADHHMPVHLLVNKAENHRLVTDKRLVVALDIRDCLLLVAAVGKLPENRGRVPVLILLLLEGLDPVVGYAHRHAIVEPNAAILESDGQARHAAHLLGDGYRVGIHGVDDLVGQSEVGYRVGVLSAVVIVAISAESLPQAVVVIEHRGHAIKAEPVKLELLQPVFAVGEQEVQHLVFPVVETE